MVAIRKYEDFLNETIEYSELNKNETPGHKNLWR